MVVIFVFSRVLNHITMLLCGICNIILLSCKFGNRMVHNNDGLIIKNSRMLGLARHMMSFLFSEAKQNKKGRWNLEERSVIEQQCEHNKYLRFRFCFIVFISHHLFTFLWWEYIHHCCKECMGRLFYLFVCYEKQKLRRGMDGEGSIYIEQGLRDGWRKVSIRSSMKEKAIIFSSRRFLLILVALGLLSCWWTSLHK
jgi:hypothetical protein